MEHGEPRRQGCMSLEQRGIIFWGGCAASGAVATSSACAKRGACVQCPDRTGLLQAMHRPARHSGTAEALARLARGRALARAPCNTGSVRTQRAFANLASPLQLPLFGETCVDGAEPPVSDLLADAKNRTSRRRAACPLEFAPARYVSPRSRLTSAVGKKRAQPRDRGQAPASEELRVSVVALSASARDVEPGSRGEQ